MSVVYTGGTFDLFHSGHVRLLKQASDMGLVVVGLNTDEFCEEYKNRTPVMTYAERFEVVQACRYVDAVLPNSGGKDSRPAILASECSVILHGDDWTGESYLRQLGVTPEWLAERGIRVAHVRYTSGVSTSDIIQRCREREAVAA